MSSMRNSLTGLACVALVLTTAPAGAAPGTSPSTQGAPTSRTHHWTLSDDTMRVGKQRAIGLKLDRHRVMWLGGIADDPADNNTSFIYDTRTGTFRETAPIPAAKLFPSASAAGVLSDGTVVLAGGSLTDLSTGEPAGGKPPVLPLRPAHRPVDAHG